MLGSLFIAFLKRRPAGAHDSGGHTDSQPRAAGVVVGLSPSRRGGGNSPDLVLGEIDLVRQDRTFQFGRFGSSPGNQLKRG